MENANTAPVSFVSRVPRSDGGFVNYGEHPIICTYSSQVEVYESSSAEAPHVWLKIEEDSRILSKQKPGEGVAHLSVSQAQELVARLQAWLDDVENGVV